MASTDNVPLQVTPSSAENWVLASGMVGILPVSSTSPLEEPLKVKSTLLELDGNPSTMVARSDASVGLVRVKSEPPPSSTKTEQALSSVSPSESSTSMLAFFVPSSEYDLVTVFSSPERSSSPIQE